MIQDAYLIYPQSFSVGAAIVSKSGNKIKSPAHDLTNTRDLLGRLTMIYWSGFLVALQRICCRVTQQNWGNLQMCNHANRGVVGAETERQGSWFKPRDRDLMFMEK